MANPEHVEKLKQGVEVWNKWRKVNSDVSPNLADAIIKDTNLKGINLSNANLDGARISEVDLYNANLQNASLDSTRILEVSFKKANLKNISMIYAHISHTDFDYANLEEAVLAWSIFDQVSLQGVNLSRAKITESFLSGVNIRKSQCIYTDLRGTNLSNVDLSEAILTDCEVYAVSVWNINLENAIQRDLIVTPYGDPPIRVDNLEIAQFIYLLLNNQKIRHVIDTITSKVVLILGRFTPERKQVLDAIRDELRNHDLLPVVFDFEKPDSRDLTETVSILAHMARFVIVDLTDPSSAPHEMATIAPHCIVPIQPLLVQDDSRYEYAMFKDLQQRYHWVLPTYRYQDIPGLLASLKEKIIEPAEQKAKALEGRKRGV